MAESPSFPNDQVLQVSPELPELWVLRCTNLLLLRRYWADSEKSLCGEATLCFHDYRNIGWLDILRNLPSCSLQIDSMIRRVYQCRFRTISLLTLVPRKTNDREWICEHNLQLSVNCIHTFLCFLVLSTQCRCTLTWSWSCLWSAQVHTVGLSLDFESSRGGSTLWCDSREYFPLELRRLAVNAIQILHMIILQIPPN